MISFSRWKNVFIVAFCLFFIYASIPSFLSETLRAKLAEYLPTPMFSLGLDLRGGSHLLMELDIAKYMREQRDILRADVREELRKEKVFFTDLRSTPEGVKFTLVPERNEGKDIRTIINRVQVGLDVEMDGDEVSVGMGETFLTEKRQQLMAQSIEILDRRVNESGTTEPIIQRQGDNRIVVQVPGLENPEQLKEILGKTANMTFHLVNEEVSVDQIMSGKPAPFGTEYLPSDDPSDQVAPGQAIKYAVYKRAELNGDLLTGANATYEQGAPVVAFKFNTVGARKFGEITSKSVGKRFAVVLDGKVLTAPVIREPILGGTGSISGNFTVESANQLAVLLRAGALPAPLTIVEERSVGPSLGADSIEAGKLAGYVGLGLIMVFMVMNYGLFGMFACVALVVNIFMLLGAMAYIGATLTMPGIAGIILTMGMAVDANVLIFERMREESRKGRTILSAIDNGFKGAMGTIMDSNVTTLLAASIMYFLGSGPIRGFAVSLSFGILCSMFTAIYLTRMLIVLWIRYARPKALPM